MSFANSWLGRRFALTLGGFEACLADALRPNFHALPPGPSTPEATNAAGPNGFSVTGLPGSGVNIVNGDFLRGACPEFRISIAAPTIVIGEMTVSGT